MTLAQDVTRQLLDNVFEGDIAVNVFVGLSTTAPTPAGGNITPPSGGGYARVSTAAADWAAAVAGSPSTKANGNPVTFPQATAAWSGGSNQTHFTLHDAATGGNYLGSGALATPKAVAVDDTPSFAAGALVAKLGAPSDSF